MLGSCALLIGAQLLLAIPLSSRAIKQSSHAISGFAQNQFIYFGSAVRLAGPVVARWIIEPAVGLAAVAGFAVISLFVLCFDRAMIGLARVENDAERRYSATLIDSLGNTNSLFMQAECRPRHRCAGGCTST